MRMRKLIWISLSACLVFQSCEKEDGLTTDTSTNDSNTAANNDNQNTNESGILTEKDVTGTWNYSQKMEISSNGKIEFEKTDIDITLDDMLLDYNFTMKFTEDGKGSVHLVSNDTSYSKEIQNWKVENGELWINDEEFTEMFIDTTEYHDNGQILSVFKLIKSEKFHSIVEIYDYSLSGLLLDENYVFDKDVYIKYTLELKKE